MQFRGSRYLGVSLQQEPAAEEIAGFINGLLTSKESDRII